MISIRRWNLLIFAAVILFCASCGGGGDVSTAAPATRAVVRLSAVPAPGFPAGTLIGTVNLTLLLPAEATVRADAVTGAVEPGVLTFTGNTQGGNTAAIIDGTYTPASAGNQARVQVQAVVPSGFAPGEFAAVNCDLGSGFAASAPFAVDTATFVARDVVNAQPIAGVVPVATVAFF